MPDSSTQSITIAAEPPAVAAVVTDFDAYPTWVNGVKIVEVLSTDDDGRAHEVRFVVDAGVVKDDYTLRYSYAPDLCRIEWDLVRGDIQRMQHGSYDLVGNGDGTTTVTYTLAVELNMPMLGMLRRKAEKMIMDTALKGLKKRVEG
jgi:ribosome-associated toxin RatA of RatAB toxin-antitoxin module